MRIGELASRTGCDVQTVRFYEREGLLPPPAREASGYRSYSERDLQRLRFIRHCRSLDMSLPEVRQLLEFTDAPVRSCGQVNLLLDEHIQQVRERLAALKSLEKQLVALRRQCKGDSGQACLILEAFASAAQEQDCACHASSS